MIQNLITDGQQQMKIIIKMRGLITIIVLLVIFSCNTTKNEMVEENKELMRFIETEISANDTYKVGEPLELSMKVTNRGESNYTFLPWGTPIENRLTGDCLLVKYKNQILDYKGIMVKRVPPTKKDYVTLENNESVAGKINILDGYSLDKKGDYTIHYKEGKGLPESNIIKISIK